MSMYTWVTGAFIVIRNGKFLYVSYDYGALNEPSNKRLWSPN